MFALWVPLLLIASAAAYLSARRWIDSRRAHLYTVRALMSAIDASDPFTRGHSYRVSRTTLAVAKKLSVAKKDWDEIEFGALLHDIGRTAIRHEVLQAPRALRENERSELHTHPTVGWEIVKAIPFLKDAAEIVYSHHERPDGRGYPRGLTGDRIPIGARIIMVTAAFDAMTQDRPYRKGLAADLAIEELRRNAGTQFFPEIVEALAELHASGELFAGFREDELSIFVNTTESKAA